MESHVISSHYLHGSGDSIVLMYRAKGQVVSTREGHEYVEERPVFVIQWGASPSFDSGYSQARFDSLDEAKEYFESRCN